VEHVLQWGVDLIVTIQKIHGPALDTFFKAITFMGNEPFYLLFLPLWLWCVDFGFGARLTVFFLLASYGNAGLKDLFQQPRPFQLNPTVGLLHAGGYGLPSGHAQSAVVVWGGIAAWMRNFWFWIMATGLILLIGFSRIYLGVHFPTDVIAGWMTGLFLLSLYVVTQTRIENWLTTCGLSLQILVAVAVPLVLLLIHPTKHTIATTAVLMGVGSGLALTHRYRPFNTQGPWWQRLFRFLIGGAVIFVFYVGLKALFPHEDSVLYPIFRFVRYLVIGLWASFGGPWLFRVLRLAPAERAPA
jgi:membrane-associated phospholipid phosphatase